MEPKSPINDVFKFLNVRSAQTLTEEQVSSLFVTYNFFNSIDPNNLQDIENTEQLLYTQLVSALSEENPREEMETVVNNYRTNSNFYWETKTDLNTFFSGFNLILDYLISKQFLDRATPFKNKVENNFIPSTIADYLNSSTYLENKLR